MHSYILTYSRLQGEKGVHSGFPTEGTLISASAVPSLWTSNRRQSGATGIGTESELSRDAQELHDKESHFICFVSCQEVLVVQSHSVVCQEASAVHQALVAYGSDQYLQTRFSVYEKGTTGLFCFLSFFYIRERDDRPFLFSFIFLSFLFCSE